jgi:hypothetical protein
MRISAVMSRMRTRTLLRTEVVEKAASAPEISAQISDAMPDKQHRNS